jgi:hypothetical protein
MCRSVVSLKCGKGKPCLLKERLDFGKNMWTLMFGCYFED